MKTIKAVDVSEIEFIKKICLNNKSDNFNPYTDKTIVRVSENDFDLNDFDGKSLQEAISFLQTIAESAGFDVLPVFETEPIGYYGTPEAKIVFYRAETDEEFMLRQKSYKKQGSR